MKKKLLPKPRSLDKFKLPETIRVWLSSNTAKGCRRYVNQHRCPLAAAVSRLLVRGSPIVTVWPGRVFIGFSAEYGYPFTAACESKLQKLARRQRVKSFGIILRRKKETP